MKRIISLLVALSMLLTVCGGSAFAAGQTGYPDVDGTGYEAPVSILSALGIMPGYTDGNFHPYSTVTRAEMAEIGVRLRGITDYGTIVSDEEIQFKDVIGHPLAAAVAYARSIGIIDGSDDGYFYPDDPVTYEQAVKMIVGAIGYDYYATTLADYPTGYLMTANELKLTNGVGLTVGSYITRGDVAKIIYKALTVDMMVESSYTNDSRVSYEIVKGKNILNTYFDIEKIRGVVEENDRTGLYGVSTLEDGEVKIGDEIFYDGDTNVGDYVGYYVTFYALETENRDRRVIVSYKVESNRNDYFKLNAEDIEDVSLNTKAYIVEYWKSDTAKTTSSVKISTSPLVIYNGVALTDFTLNDLKPNYGQVTLIDTDNDNLYDLVDITAYDIMLVLNASASSGTISAYPAYTTGVRTVQLDETEDDLYDVRILDGEGKSVPFSSITKNSVLHVAVSKDAGSTMRTVIVSNDSITGTVQRKNDDGTYVINDKEYEVIGYMKSENAMSVGDKGTFYLTYDGRIAGFDGEDKLSMNIGMYISCNRGTFTEGGDVVKLLKSDGTFGLYNLAGTVSVNGRNYKGTDLFELIADEESPLFGKRQPDSENSGKIIAEPSMAGILYKLNNKGDITEIIMNASTTASRTVPEMTTDTGYTDKEIRCVVQRGRNSGWHYGNINNTNLVNGTGSDVPDRVGRDRGFSANYQKRPDNRLSTTDGTYRLDSLYYSTKYHSFHRAGNQVFVTDGTVLMLSSDNDTKVDDSQVYSVMTPSQLWENYYFEWYEAYFYYVGDNQYASYAVMYDDFDVTQSSNSSSNSGPQEFYQACLGDRIRVVDRIVEYYDPENGDVHYRLMYWEGGSSTYADFHENYEDARFRSGQTLWRRGDIVRFVRFEGKIGRIESIFGTSWNDPTSDEADGGKNSNQKYKFPYGLYSLNGYWSERQLYYVGRIMEIDALKYFSKMNIKYGSGENDMLYDEPVEGDCFRFVYDNRGYIIGVDSVGNGSLAENQLVLVRRQGNANNLNLRVKESYILYEYDEISDSQTLRETYEALYSEGWTSDATTESLGDTADNYDDLTDVYYSEFDAAPVEEIVDTAKFDDGIQSL